MLKSLEGWKTKLSLVVTAALPILSAFGVSVPPSVMQVLVSLGLAGVGYGLYDKIDRNSTK
jgi:hypothetical protein